jgi:hypothetical protein
MQDCLLIVMPQRATYYDETKFDAGNRDEVII